jgi:hypothetical protein
MVTLSLSMFMDMLIGTGRCFPAFRRLMAASFRYYQAG